MTTVFEPTFETTVPRGLLHKAGPEAVWMTEMVALGDDRYRCAGHVPRTHSYVNDTVPPRYDAYDFAFLVEYGRQAGIAVTHQHLGVPVSYATIFMKLAMTVVDPVPNEVPLAPVPVVADVLITNEERENGMLTAVSADVEFRVDDVLVATARTMCKLYEPNAYKAMRAEMRGRKPLEGALAPRVATLPAARVGRFMDDNVLIAAPRRGPDDTFTADVRVAVRHPYFFEHPMDHIPGVHILETFRQMGIACATEAHGLSPNGTVVTSANTRFTGFGELELPVACDVRLGEPRPDDGHVIVPARLTARQPGSGTLAESRLQLRFAKA